MAGGMSHGIYLCVKIISNVVFLVKVSLSDNYIRLLFRLGREPSHWTGVWLWFVPPAVLAGREDNRCRRHRYPALLRLLRLSVL